MDAYTLFKFTFTFEMWGPTLDTDGNINGYTFVRTGTGLLSPGAAQTYMFTKTPLEFGWQVRTVRDAKDNVVFGTTVSEYPVYVTASEPTFDHNGVVSGYRQILNRNSPVT